MAQYLSPGVYVEEIPGPQTIEGVSTSTAGFVGPARMGPINGTPPVLTCLSDFIAIYGSLDELTFDDQGQTINYLAQSVREFFDNGGSLLYVSRIFNPPPNAKNAGPNPPAVELFNGAETLNETVPYGYSWAVQPIAASSPPTANTVAWTGRYPGIAGDVQLVITLSISPNVLSQAATAPNQPPTNTLGGVRPYDVVWISPMIGQISSPPGSGAGGCLYWAESYLNKATGQTSWRFHARQDDTPGSGTDVSLLPYGTQVYVLKATVEINYINDSVSRIDTYPGVTFDPRSSQSFAGQFGPLLANQTQQLQVPVVFNFNAGGPAPPPPANASWAAGIQIAQIMLDDVFTQSGVTIASMISGKTGQVTVQLEWGADGDWPAAVDYQPLIDPSAPKSGLTALEDITNISIVAAPGSTHNAGSDPTQPLYQQALQTTFNLITHCEKMAYRIAVLDSPDNYSVSQIQAWRGQFDSSYAALYYPWVQIVDPTVTTPNANAEITLPPSGFVAGIYARSDQEVGPQKAPANEVVTDAIGFELMLNKGQQDVLNPIGVNCFRYFPNRGYLLWGARTATSDTEWQYVNLRRYMNYLKQSIDQGTQYVVFENNGPDTWANVQQIVSDFLYNEFVNGRLFGTTKAQAFFVRCDQTTMTQNDIDNGRLVCLIGVALLRPAEFVIFRIGQFTASSGNGS
jgi:uncharacterized protein